MSSQLHKDIYGDKWRRSRDINSKSTADRGTPYENIKEDPNYANSWKTQNIKQYKEAVYDKISELLISNFSKIEQYVDGDSIEAIQKTYKEGKLTKGKQDSDMLVVYEKDTHANMDDKAAENAIMRWLEFTDPKLISLEIVSTLSGNEEFSEVDLKSPPDLVLSAPDKSPLNINSMLGVLGVEGISIKDNVSQFMELKKTKTNINRSKLKEYVDTEFSELTPVTFTNLLEKYNKFKNDIPFYRYRTDDFFNEYDNAINIPGEYRVEKFFDEFEKIKDIIPRGTIAGQSSVIIDPEQDMFGFGTMTYLIKEARNAMGDNDIPVWSNNEVVSFTTKITELETTISEQSTEIANLQLELELTQDTNLDNVLQTLSSEGGGDTGDGSGGKKGGLMKKINSRRTTKHPPIRKYKSGGSVKKSTSKDEEHIHTYTVDNNMNGWTDMAFHPTESNIRHRHRIVNGKIMTAQSGCYPDCNKIYGVDGVPPHTHNL